MSLGGAKKPNRFVRRWVCAPSNEATFVSIVTLRHKTFAAATSWFREFRANHATEQPKNGSTFTTIMAGQRQHVNQNPPNTKRRVSIGPTEFGMQNTRNLYSIASSCFNCHTVPNEELVNVGGHKAGSEDFELVRWSQGQVRHNFLRVGGQTNAISETPRLRVMFVVGLIADLEFSTRATAKAMTKSTYGMTVANRAARTSVKLYEVQQMIKDPNVQRALEAFAQAELRTENQDSLLAIADEIRRAGEKFAAQEDGARLAVIDSLLPKPSEYK